MNLIRPDQKTLKKVRTKLMSEGMLKEAPVKELRSRLMIKKKNAPYVQFLRKRQLDQSIAALTYLLKEMENERQEKNSPPPTTDPGK